MYRPPGAPPLAFQPSAAPSFQPPWPPQQPPGPAQSYAHLQQQQQQQQQQQPGFAGWAPPAAAPPPPPLQPPQAAFGQLRSVEELPACFRPVFPFRFFNAIQNECWPAIWEGGSNLVVAAPTGGGKTVLLELAILRMLTAHISPAGQFQHRPGHLKAVYLAPSRALVQEKVRDWSQRFAALGLDVRELTGDTDREGLEALDTADVVCATPEKFDAVTRSGMRFFADIGLVLIDEVHLLSESRGSSLEGVVARIKVVSRLREMREQPIGRARYVAVSATVPNLQDLAEWLGAPPAGIKAFGEEMRPVKLRTVVRGYQPTKTDFLFERRLNDFIFQIVADHSSGKPSLVFCSSRRGTSETAAHLAREAAKAAGRSPTRSAFVRDGAQAGRLAAAAAGLRDVKLRECLAAGVGCHHAAMEPADRAAVEALFVAQDLAVLCTTSTLAMGVNLPARLVVIKARHALDRGTRRYIGSEAEDASGYQEYERSTCLQMVGRAGRPQFDTEGVAVIMTEKQNVRRYEQLMSGSELVESTLKDVLPELLNAEITLHTITDVPQAIDWLRSTYLYTRIKRAPDAYGIPRQPSAEALDRWLRDRLLLGALRELAEHGLVRLHDDGVGLEPLAPGRIMAEKYVRLATMKLLCGAPSAAGLPALVDVVSKSAELANIKLRRSEKKVLNEVNRSDRARFKIMDPSKPSKVLERISSGPHKIFVLVNEALTDAPPDSSKLDYSLKQDMEQAVSVGQRLAGAMVRLFEHTGRASETFNALLLQKSLRQRMWTDSQLETRQLPGIGPLIAQRLASAGVHKLAQLAAIEPRRLEALAQRHYPFGNDVHSALAGCMPPAVSLRCQPVAWLTGGLVELEVTVERTGSSAAPSPARLLVGSLHDNALLLCRALALESFPSPLVLRTRTQSPPSSKGAPVQLVASIVHERLVGVDQAIKVVVPPGVQLQGQACQPAAKQPAPAAVDSGGSGDSALDKTEGMAAAGALAGSHNENEEPPAAASKQHKGSSRGGRKAGPTSGALQVMQRKLSAAPAQQAAGQTEAPTAAPPAAAPAAPAQLPLQQREDVPAAAAPTPPTATKSKWSSFVPAAATPGKQQQQQQQQPGSLQQMSIQAALRRGAAAAAAAQAGRPPLGSKPAAAAAAPPVPIAADFAACQPPSLAAGAHPGGLFSQFAMGASGSNGRLGSAGMLKAAGGGVHGWGQGRGLLGATPPATNTAQKPQQLVPAAAVGEAAAAEAPSKRRRLQPLLPSPEVAGLAPAPAAAAPAPALPPKALNLPKLGWLSSRFSQPSLSQPATAAVAPVALSAVEANPQQQQQQQQQQRQQRTAAAAASAPMPDFSSIFGFL